MAYRTLAKTNDEAAFVELTVCANDPVHWLSHWAWTYDPREPTTTIPFDLFPKQAEFITWLADRERLQEDGLAEKSRDTGVTWLCVGFAAHRWLFKSGYQIGFDSRKLEYVDKRGDPKCIFDKLRFLIDNLPRWMLPRGFDRVTHDSYAQLINPENGSSITGEGGDNIGRGGRSTMYFVDEAAFLENPQIVDRALSQTTRCRIDVSTPNGPGTPFATKRFSGKCSVFISTGATSRQCLPAAKGPSRDDLCGSRGQLLKRRIPTSGGNLPAESAWNA